MEQFWRSTAVRLGKHWTIVLLACLGITAALALGLTRLEFATGQDSYLDADTQAAIDNVTYQEQFGGETVVLLFSGEDDRDVTDLFSGDNLAELERITAELQAIPEAANVVTPLVSLQFSDALIQNAGRNALISASQRDPDPDAQAARTADIGIGLARLGAVENPVIGDPEWADLLVWGNEGFVSGDDGVVAPAQEDLQIRLSLASTFPDQQTAVGGVVLEGNADLDSLSAGTEAVIDIVDSANFDGFELIATGSPVFLREINDYLQGGMITLGLIAMAVMAVILLVMFPVRWRLLPLLSVLVGIVWAFAIVGFVGIDLSLVTISGLPILIGVGIDFAIQIHNRVEEEVVLDKETHPIGETLANLAPALIVATIAGVLAFLALRVSQVPMIRDFGVLLSIGIVVLVITGLTIPTSALGIREWTARTQKREKSIVEQIVVKLGSVPAKAAPPLIALAVLAFGVGIFVEGGIEIESDPVKWIDQGSQTVADIDRLEEETGFATTLGILIESNNIAADEVNQLVWDFTLAAEQRPEVVSTSSLANTLGKIILVEGATPLAPTAADIEGAIADAPPDIKRALVSEDQTATQINLRLAPASLEDRAVLIDELEADLAERIEALDIPADSVLLVDLGENDDAIKAVPAGLAVVGVSLLDNLKANRAVLTYLGLAVVFLWLIGRHRSLTRAALAMVPVGLAVGLSSIVVGASGIVLSPLTTVSGPLVIATCTEFSVLILARYLEEREHGLEAKAATDQAASRTGRAFFTSAATTIGGFAVLMVSPLPLLRDFGIIVTLNVAIALLAALIVMPPMLVWADGKGLLSIERRSRTEAVKLAARAQGPTFVTAIVGFVAVAALAIGLFVSADESTGATEELAFMPVALPTPTPEPTPEPPPEPEGGIDVSQFGTDRPTGLIDGTLFDLLTGVGVDPQQAVCTGETLLSRTTEADLLASGIATFSEEAVVPVVEAGLDCGISQEQIDATLAAARGE